MSMCLLPSTIIVQQHFRKRRALASGISYCGINLCFLTLGPLIRLLLDIFGWHGVVLLHGAAMLHIQIFAFAFRPPIKPSNTSSKPSEVTKKLLPKSENLDTVYTSNETTDTRDPLALKSTTLSIKELSPVAESPYSSDDHLLKQEDNNAIDTADTQSFKPRRKRTMSQNCESCEESIDIVKHSLEYTHSHAHMYSTTKTSETDADYKKDTIECDGCNEEAFIKSEKQLKIEIQKPTRPTPAPGLKGFAKQILNLFDRSILKETNFVLIMIAGACIQASMMSFHQHFVRRAILRGVDKHLAALLPTCIGIASMVSRITFGFIGSFPRVNRVLLYAGKLSNYFVIYTTF